MLLRALMFVALLAVPAAARNGIPDLTHCYWFHGLAEEAGACVCPAGDGDPLPAMRRGGDAVDGTVTVVLLDSNDQPIANYPAEDIWLEVPGMDFCVPPLTADGPSDLAGVTTISGAPLFLGEQAGDLAVLINGEVLPDAGGALYRFAAVDLDGSGTVDFRDLILLANAYFSGGYVPAADFHCDGRLDLSDVVVFAGHLGHRCP